MFTHRLIPAFLAVLAFLSQAAVAQTPLHRWNFNTPGSSSYMSTNGLVLTETSSTITDRRGVSTQASDNALGFYGGYLKSPTVQSGIESQNAFSVSGWFGLENVEGYLAGGPQTQFLAGEWNNTGGCQWALYFERDPYTITAVHRTGVHSGRLCFVISHDGTTSSVSKVYSSMQAFTDGFMFMAASYDSASSKLKLYCGNNKHVSADSAVATALIYVPNPALGAAYDGALSMGATANGNEKTTGFGDELALYSGVFSASSALQEAQRIVACQRQTMAFFGNSITWGYASTSGTQNKRYHQTGSGSYPAQVADLLAPYGYAVANYGSPGSESEYGPVKFSQGNLPASGAMPATEGAVTMDYDWVCVSYGVNDLKISDPASHIEANLSTMYYAILNSSPNVKLVKLTISPCKSGFGYPTSTATTNDATISAVNAWIKAFNPTGYSGRIYTVDMFEALKSTGTSADPYLMNPSYALPSDNIHPNTAGTAVMAKLVANRIAGLDYGLSTMSAGVSVVDGPDYVSKTITSTATTGWFNAGGGSTVPVPVGGYLMYSVFPVPATAGTNNTQNSSIMVGLSSADPDNGYLSIDYALYTRFDNKVYAYSNGTKVFDPGSNSAFVFNENTVFRIERNDCSIVFYKDNTLVKTFAVSPSTNFYLDFAIFKNSTEIRNLIIYTPPCGYEPRTSCSGARPLAVAADAPGVESLVYPNPAGDRITVGAAGAVAVYDIQGKLVLRLDAREPNQSIEIGQLPKGLYLVTVTNGAVVKKTRFVKE